MRSACTRGSAGSVSVSCRTSRCSRTAASAPPRSSSAASSDEFASWGLSDPQMTVRLTDEMRDGTQPAAIRLSGVVKRYGAITAVDHLDLEVPEGTCVGLLGPNGAGKSTTMRLLTAQAIADEGELEVLGFRLPAESKQARAQLGVSPQLDNLDVTLTVE